MKTNRKKLKQNVGATNGGELNTSCKYKMFAKLNVTVVGQEDLKWV